MVLNPVQVKLFVLLFVMMVCIFFILSWQTVEESFMNKYDMDMNRDVYIQDIPFTPHTILNSYDFVDTTPVVSLPTPPDLDNINVPLEQNYKEHSGRRVADRDRYKCFGKIEFTQKECEAPTDLVGNRVPPGVWDTACIQNTDCPFYKANQNYPNTFGKCANGLCQMPKGVQRIGYRQFSKNTLPLCYNCTVGTHHMGTCCAHQRQPDYVFDDDLRLRYKHRDELAKKGLTTVTHDDNRQEFRKLEKTLKII
jgi:hypothetical protein